MTIVDLSEKFKILTSQTKLNREVSDLKIELETKYDDYLALKDKFGLDDKYFLPLFAINNPKYKEVQTAANELFLLSQKISRIEKSIVQLKD